MKNLKINLLFIFAIISPSIAFSQIKFEIHANCGASNFIEKSKEEFVVTNNYYTYQPSYMVGTECLYNFKSSRFGIISGLNFISFGAKNHMKDLTPSPFAPPYTEPTEWNERVYALSIPLKLNYQFEKWIYINAGFANTLNIIKDKKIVYKKVNFYTLNFVAGFDFIIRKRFIIGAMYHRDILPTMNGIKLSPEETLKIKYNIEQITVKIGYVINGR